MKFRVYFCLGLFVCLAGASPRKAKGGRNEPKKCAVFEITVENQQIPSNTWITAIPVEAPWYIKLSRHYYSIKYRRLITSASPIYIHYNVEAKSRGFFRKWHAAYAGEGNLQICKMESEPRSFHITQLVRYYLGFPNHCPVADRPEGTQGDPEKFLEATGAVRVLVVPHYYQGEDIRIRVDIMHLSPDKEKEDKLFEGTFNFEFRELYAC